MRSFLTQARVNSHIRFRLVHTARAQPRGHESWFDTYHVELRSEAVGGKKASQRREEGGVGEHFHLRVRVSARVCTDCSRVAQSQGGEARRVTNPRKPAAGLPARRDGGTSARLGQWRMYTVTAAAQPGRNWLVKLSPEDVRLSGRFCFCHDLAPLFQGEKHSVTRRQLFQLEVGALLGKWLPERVRAQSGASRISVIC